MKLAKFIIFPAIILAGCNSSLLVDPTTTISYSIDVRSHVTVTIGNSYNTTIATLTDEDMDPGIHTAGFNGSNLAEGIYFYTIEIKGIQSNYYSKTTKYILLVKQ